MPTPSTRPSSLRPPPFGIACASPWLLALALGCSDGPTARGTEPIGTRGSGESGLPTADGSDVDTAGADGSQNSTTGGAVQTDGASQGADDDSGGETGGDDESGTDGPQESGTDATDTGTSSDDGETTGEQNGSSTGESSTGEALEPIDVSGWTLVQTDSAREIILPEGTILEAGGALVIARDASQPAFEDWWGATMDGAVVFIDSDNDFPAINGDETFTLLDALGGTVDGPTPALALGGNLQREAVAADGWLSTVASTANATPGLSQTTQSDAGHVVISEVSDAPGNGTFAYEFVELAFVAP